MNPYHFENMDLGKIQEEFELGDRVKKYKGKTIKIKKLVKKESGSFTLKDTLIHGDDSANTSVSDLKDLTKGFGDPNVNQELGRELGDIQRILQASPEKGLVLAPQNLDMTRKEPDSRTFEADIPLSESQQ